MTAQDDSFPVPPDEEPSEQVRFISEAHQNNVSDLFKRNRDLLVRYVASRIPAGSDAHEIVDAAFEKLLTVKNPDSVTSLQAFLFTIARNLAVNRNVHTAMRDRKAPIIGFDINLEIPSPEVSAMDLERQQQVQQVPNVVSELPPKIRMAITLRYWDNLSSAQIVARFAENGFKVTERTISRYLKKGLETCARGILAAEGQQQEAGK